MHDQPVSRNRVARREPPLPPGFEIVVAIHARG
jgi:hypothetical protein